jgi:UDP-N-acetylglucosamine 2-epimerase (non-hydrolysing)
MSRSIHKIAFIFGTRPEAIKLAPVILEMQRREDTFCPLVWLTAQHRQMLDQVMSTFELKADRDFNIMKEDQSLTSVTADVLKALEETFLQEQPDAILVQGDTTTVFAAALAAYYARIPVGHVEAGLRTDNKFSPFPEEMNRRLATRLTDFHFAPTERARNNLLNEGVPQQKVWLTGNTVIDALDIIVKRVQSNRPSLPSGFPRAVGEEDRRMVLITGHRRENFGAGFESICRAIAELSRRYPDTEFVYPVHLNPNVRKPVFELLRGHANISLIDPLEYEQFVWAMNRCYFLLSDSGGVQEEAPHLGKPVLVMREVTERPEALEAGSSKLVGVNYEMIVGEAARLLENPDAYASMSRAHNPFGDGRASVRIADVLVEQL